MSCNAPCSIRHPASFLSLVTCILTLPCHLRVDSAFDRRCTSLLIETCRALRHCPIYCASPRPPRLRPVAVLGPRHTSPPISHCHCQLQTVRAPQKRRYPVHVRLSSTNRSRIGTYQYHPNPTCAGARRRWEGATANSLPRTTAKTNGGAADTLRYHVLGRMLWGCVWCRTHRSGRHGSF